MPHARRGTRQDDRARLQGRSLRAEANNFRHGEDQITIHSKSVSVRSRRDPNIQNQNRSKETHSSPQSCKTFPFFKPLNLNFPGSEIAAVEAKTGPIGQAPSNPFE